MNRVGAALLVLLLRDVPFWTASPWRRVARILVLVGYAYLGVLLVLLALENYFLFRPTRASDEWDDPPRDLAVEDVWLESPDGAIHGWWSAPAGWAPDRGAVLICHGNGGNLSGRADSLRDWRDSTRQGVLIFDYPGYGRSGGKPSEAGCYRAGDAALDWLTGPKGVAAGRVLLFGNSLGGGIALDLAARRDCRAVATQAAFSSFPDMAQLRYPWLPARWLVTNQFDNVGKIARLKVPAFVAHGTADGLVPYEQGERLYAAAPEPKRFLRLEGQGHEDGVAPRFHAELQEFLRDLGR